MDILIFIAIELAIVAGLFLYVVYKKGSIKNARDYLTTTEGKGIMKGIVLACVVTLILILSAKVAHAGELKWGGETVIFAGLDRNGGPSPFCADGGVDDKLTSNIGVRQYAMSYEFSQKSLLKIGGKYTHHSCALNIDRELYDGIGITVELIID